MILQQTCPRVGIVILNWRRPKDTLACLGSLARLDYPSFEIVVVDNGSGDGSPALIRERFPHVGMIENGCNLGFAAACNVGIGEVLRHGVDYVLLLNEDTEVAPDLVDILVRVAEADPTIGILGPKIYYYDQTDRIWSAGGQVGRFGIPQHRCVDEVDQSAPDWVRDVDYVTGCAMLVRRQVIDLVGMLDERFFAYYEETEWCARARRAGFRVVYVPDARMWHKIKMADRTASHSYLYLMARNRLLYLRCRGAHPGTILVASADVLRTAASWWLRPKHRAMRPFAGTLVRGVLDFVAGRFGPPARSF